MTEKGEIVTIDGPSGSGKSTISRKLAQRLNYTYLDTGAMYRAVGLLAQRRNIAFDDEKAIGVLLTDLDLQLLPGAVDTRVLLEGEDVSAAIRTAEMGMAASAVSALPVVREKLTQLQQQLGRRGAVVAEGRDTGTVVFPQARYKFYLDASAEERARRRCNQLRQTGQDVNEEEILKQLIRRDHDDSSRTIAPLRAADDAIIINSSQMTIAEVLDFMMEQLAKK
jgi:cytidylate kinase